MRRRIDFDRGRGWRGCEDQTLRTGASRFVFGNEVRGRQGRLAAHLRRIDRGLGARPRACARCAAAGRSDDYPARSRIPENQRRRWRRHRARARALRTPGSLRRPPWLPIRAPSAAKRTKYANRAPNWLTAGSSPARRTANRNAASGCVTSPFRPWAATQCAPPASESLMPAARRATLPWLTNLVAGRLSHGRDVSG